MLREQQEMIRMIPSALRGLAAAAGLVLLVGGLAGCQKTLFGAQQPRTQFEQYDRTHGSYVPPTLTDRNGLERPALRERLRVPSG